MDENPYSAPRTFCDVPRCARRRLPKFTAPVLLNLVLLVVITRAMFSGHAVIAVAAALALVMPARYIGLQSKRISKRKRRQTKTPSLWLSRGQK